MGKQESLFAAANRADLPVLEGVRKRQLVVGRRMHMTEYFFEAEVAEGSHSHKTEEIGYIVAGEFEMQVGDDSRVLSSGDAYSLPAGKTHGVRCVEPGSYVLVTLVGVEHVSDDSGVQRGKSQ